MLAISVSYGNSMIVLSLAFPYPTITLNQTTLPLTSCCPSAKAQRIMTEHYLSISCHWHVCLLKASHIGFGCSFSEFQLDSGLSLFSLIKIILFLAVTSNPEKKTQTISHTMLLFITYKIITKPIIYTNKNESDSLNYFSERIYYQIFLLLCCSPVNSQCEW